MFSNHKRKYENTVVKFHHHSLRERGIIVITEADKVFRKWCPNLSRLDLVWRTVEHIHRATFFFNKYLPISESKYTERNRKWLNYVACKKICFKKNTELMIIVLTNKIKSNELYR